MKIAVYLLAAVLAIIAVVLMWESAFALAVAWYSHSWALWGRFTRGLELVLPAQTAINEWSNPVVAKLVGRATLGATVALVVVSVTVSQIVQNLRGIAAPKGGSRLAKLVDLKKADLLNGKPGYSVFLGRFGGKDVRYSGASHIYVNGPTRAGKGVGFVLPNALEWRGSLIGLDIKREMWTEVTAARAAMGQKVFLFSPGSPESHCWNPLDLVSPWPERATDVANIARSLISTPTTGDAYWAETARGLFAGLLGYVLDSETMRGKRTIKSALKMFSRGRSLAAEMALILVNEPELNEFVKDKFRQHMGREDKQRMSFEAHVTTALDAWNNSLIDDVTGRSDFDISELRRTPFTILIGTPIGNFGTVESVVRLLVQQVHDVLLKSLPGLDEPHKLLLMLDEFYQFGRMPEIVDRAPLVAGYGFQIALIAQGLTQLDVRYGRPTRDMLVGNMDVKLLIGVGDETTARYCADEMGKHYVRREGWGTSVGGGFIGGGSRASRSTQGRWELEPLMTSEALRRLDTKKSVLLVRGQYGAVLDKINFFEDAIYRRRVKQTAAFKAQITIPGVNGPNAVTETSTWREASQLEAPALLTASSSKHLAAYERVMAAAESVFSDTREFETAFLHAMNQSSNAPIAELCRTLRIEPETLGPLWVRRVRPFVGAPGFDTQTQVLRADIFAARQALNNDRAERVDLSVGSIAPTPEPIIVTALPPSIAVTGSVAPATVGDTAAVSSGGGQVETSSPAEGPGADALGLVAGVDDESAKLIAAFKIAATSLDPETRAEIERATCALSDYAALFVDAPDDLPEVLTA